MTWVRIDNRLIHGQVIETWLPFTGARTIMVFNDDLAEDEMRQDIMSLAIPNGVDIQFLPLRSASSAWGAKSAKAGAKAAEGGEALILFATCQDARRAYESGLLFDLLNVGNLHFEPGKRQVCPHVALTNEDEGCLDFFTGKGVRLDFRCVPGDPTLVRSYK